MCLSPLPSITTLKTKLSLSTSGHTAVLTVCMCCQISNTLKRSTKITRPSPSSAATQPSSQMRKDQKRWEMPLWNTKWDTQWLTTTKCWCGGTSKEEAGQVYWSLIQEVCQCSFSVVKVTSIPSTSSWHVLTTISKPWITVTQFLYSWKNQSKDNQYRAK